MFRRVLAGLLLFLMLQQYVISSVMACCSIAPASFKKTYGWAGEFRKDGNLMHILLYENQPADLSLRPNAMILPIPAIPGSVTDANMLDGRDFVGVAEKLYNATKWNFFDDIETTIAGIGQIVRQLPAIIAAISSGKYLDNLSSAGAGVPQGVQVFTKGSYTVVLAPSAKDIPEALARVPVNKRPEINSEIFDAYDKWYPGWTFALCCFNRDDSNPEPLVWIYEPKDPNYIFFPALDAHTGRAPELNTTVKVDHRLVISSHKEPWYAFAGPVLHSFRDVPLETFSSPSHALLSVLPAHAMARQFSDYRLQGDFQFTTDDVRAGILRPLRRNPEAVANNDVLDFADSAFENDGLIAKVVLGYLLAFLLLHAAGLHASGNRIGWGFLIMVVLGAVLLSAEATSTYELKVIGFSRLLVAFAALIIPIEAAMTHKDDLKLPGYVLLACLCASLYYLPGYSSGWLPIAWAGLLLYLLQHESPFYTDEEPLPPTEEPATASAEPAKG